MILRLCVFLEFILVCVLEVVRKCPLRILVVVLVVARCFSHIVLISQDPPSVKVVASVTLNKLIIATQAFRYLAIQRSASPFNTAGLAISVCTSHSSFANDFLC